MAVLLSGLGHKSVSDTQPGELYRMPLRGGNATCITLEIREGGQFLVGILQSPAVDRPSYLITDGKIPCASYGADWLIEPVYGAESFPSNGYAERTERTLYLASDRALLRFDRPQNPNSFDYVFGNLLAGGCGDRTENDVPVSHWRIWASEADRIRPGAKPVVEFGAPEKPV
ncbi:hypothetical protein LB553_00345 [Mesorhizobium sp. CA8]|uniref:hypothetical protein n=1 Tax=Mesorhizobium sp. CA8 TaxID=2876637 RepID=UPI001CC9A2A9|nr:hypothetical protein [Mesorhizobium sp. CA8]MBZ9759340.1 hypothetical protein [Mesorhizobium sp. CA8]